MAPSNSFFSNNSATQAECDSFAETAFGGPAALEKPHGAYSYTLVARDSPQVVQFRESGGSTLPEPDDPLFKAFVGAHPGLVPVHQFIGTVGTLSAHRMPRLDGVSFSDANTAFHLQPQKWMVLVEDLASYFANSLRFAGPSAIVGPDYERAGIKEGCLRRLDHLYGTLPSRFYDAVEHVMKHIDDLFDPSTSCPCVPLHGDLSKTNIFVNPDTGNLTGVIDLAELDCLPFGFDFYAIDEVLGEWRPEGWAEHADAAKVRAHFWSTLLELTDLPDQAQHAVRLAWLAGILFRYGTRYDAEFTGMLGTLGDSGIGIQILDGLISQYYP